MRLNPDSRKYYDGCSARKVNVCSFLLLKRYPFFFNRHLFRGSTLCALHGDDWEEV